MNTHTLGTLAAWRSLASVHNLPDSGTLANFVSIHALQTADAAQLLNEYKTSLRTMAEFEQRIAVPGMSLAEAMAGQQYGADYRENYEGPRQRAISALQRLSKIPAKGPVAASQPAVTAGISTGVPGRAQPAARAPAGKLSPIEVSAGARAYIAEQAAAGREINAAEAVDHIAETCGLGW